MSDILCPLLGAQHAPTLRSLARTPWYSLTVVGVIALATALTTSVLAVVDGVLFKPLPYRQPERLFAVTGVFSRLPGDNRALRWRASPVEFETWREAVPGVQLTAFSDALYETDTLESASRASVDAHFFETLGVAIRGPGFVRGDFVPGAPVSPVVVTHALWQSQYALDPSAIGRTFVDSHGVTCRVVGVLPAGFVFPNGPWLTPAVRPLVVADPGSRTRNLTVLVRLADGVTPQQVAERLTAATGRLAATWPAIERPDDPERIRIIRGPFDAVRLDPLHEALATRSIQTARIAFWAAVALMLLACLNVAGLAVARLHDRNRDLVVRRALGARYLDLVRLLAAENAVVATAGAALGVLGARALLAATTTLMPRSLHFLKAPAVDGRILALSALAAAASVLFITFLPARWAWRSGLQSSLGGGGAVTPRLRRRTWSIVSGQVAVVTVMAVGGALVVGSLLRVWGEDPGFDVSRVSNLIVGTLPSPAGTLEDVVDAVRGLPGVRSAGGIDHPLLEKSFNGNSFDAPPGAASVERNDPSDVIEQIGVTSGYLETVGLRPLDGRLLSDTECATGAPVIVVSDRVARRYWPRQRAVGQVLMNKGRAFSVVGVVRDARYLSLDMDPQPAIYWPVAATARPLIYHLLATFDGSGRAGVREVSSAFRKRCPGCTVYKAEMLSDALGASIRPRRFNAWLFSSFGVAALVIVGTGILGLVAMSTGRRTKEIGIRMALGSTRGGVVRQILREQAGSVGAGLAAGALVAAWAVKYVEAYLYKTPPYDAWSWSGAIAVILAVALAGALIPALRASRLDPIRALRVE